MHLRHLLCVKSRWASILVLLVVVLSIVSTHYYFSTSLSTKIIEQNGLSSGNNEEPKVEFDKEKVALNDNKIEEEKADTDESNKEEGESDSSNTGNKPDEKVEEEPIDDATKEKMLEEDLVHEDENLGAGEADKDDKDDKSPKHKVGKEVVVKLIENIDDSAVPVNDAVIEKVEKILDEEIKDENSPEPLDDSSYPESEQNALSDEDAKIIEEEISEMKENANVNVNPADPNKDWSIKYNEELNKVTASQLLEGNSHVKDFFRQVAELMHGNRLSFPLQQRMRMENGKTIIDPIITRSDWADDLNEKELESLFHFPEEFVEDATIKHKIVTDNIPNLTPQFYSGNGYVVVGGGKYSWFALLAIETLRKIGSKLPVEVFIPTEEEYEPDFCEVVLPRYNARCIKISSIFDEEALKDVKITGYQYKSIALLASSFENAFLLDSDNYPVKNPDPIFDSEVYLSNTMITWPDYWRRTTSPKYYQITGKKIGKQVRFLDDEDTDPKYYTKSTEVSDEDLREKVQFHNREGTIKEWTTESGQMLINKKIHFRALLLALYYNLEGQFGYYPLLSQGGAGEGDKETFVAAATYYGLKYYQVRKKPDRAYGYYKWEGWFIDSSIIQYDPMRDYRVLQHINREIESRIELDGREFRYNYFDLQQHKISIEISKPMFYHVHETKMDPFKLYQDRATYDQDGKKLRNLGGDFPRFGFDLEAFLWRKTKEHFCVERTPVAFLVEEGKEQIREEICGEFMSQQLRFLAKSNRVLRRKYNYDTPYQNLERSKDLF